MVISKMLGICKVYSMAIAALALTGCTVSSVSSVAIEDRSITQGAGSGPVLEERSDVQVSALNVRPSFKATDNANQSIQSRPKQAVDLQSKAPEIVGVKQSPAAIALLNTAKSQSRSGSLRAAQSSLERALRISPSDSQVYQSLGEVHRLLGEYVQAEQMTLKGISLASGQSSKLRRLWSALAKIRSESGDSSGANAAFKKSQSY